MVIEGGRFDWPFGEGGIRYLHSNPRVSTARVSIARVRVMVPKSPNIEIAIEQKV